MPPKELGARSQRWLCTSNLRTGLGPEPLIYSLNEHSARQPQATNRLVGRRVSTQGNQNVPDASSFVSQGSSEEPNPTLSAGVFKPPGASSLPRLETKWASPRAVPLPLHLMHKDFNIPFGILRTTQVLKS